MNFSQMLPMVKATGGGDSYNGAKALVMANRGAVEKLELGDDVLYRLGDAVTSDDINNAILAYNGHIVPFSSIEMSIEDYSEEYGFSIFIAFTKDDSGNAIFLAMVIGEEYTAEGISFKVGTYIPEAFTTNVLPTALIYNL